VNGYLIWYLWIATFALVTLSRAGRVFGAGLSVWRGQIAELLVRNVLIGIGFPLFSEWLVVFLLISTSPNELAAPDSGYMAYMGFMSIVIGIGGIVAAVREMRAWIAWSSYYRGAALLRDKRYAEARSQELYAAIRGEANPAQLVAG